MSKFRKDCHARYRAAMLVLVVVALFAGIRGATAEEVVNLDDWARSNGIAFEEAEHPALLSKSVFLDLFRRWVIESSSIPGWRDAAEKFPHEIVIRANTDVGKSGFRLEDYYSGIVGSLRRYGEIRFERHKSGLTDQDIRFSRIILIVSDDTKAYLQTHYPFLYRNFSYFYDSDSGMLGRDGRSPCIHGLARVSTKAGKFISMQHMILAAPMDGDGVGAAIVCIKDKVLISMGIKAGTILLDELYGDARTSGSEVASALPEPEINRLEHFVLSALYDPGLANQTAEDEAMRIVARWFSAIARSQR